MKPDFSKYPDKLIPVIIQDHFTKTVLMLGYMNEDALRKTTLTGYVTFFSRSKGRLWTKGETSGNFLKVIEIKPDCDNDAILVRVVPEGHVCHTGQDTCFGEGNNAFSLSKLERTIASRQLNAVPGSYTASLFSGGINKIAQKLGEEAIELVIESKDYDDERFLNEAADLLFHFLVLLRQRNFQLNNVISVLEKRENQTYSP